jgi:SH3-like domain-containing protein
MNPSRRSPHPWPRWLAWPLLALALLLAGAAQAQTMVSVDRPKINLRVDAGTQHPVDWVLNRGFPLQVLGRRDGWLHVRDFEGDTGWVLARLTARKPHVIVKVKAANLRSGPGTTRRLVGRAEYGEVLRTLDRRPGWVRVRQAGGVTGWVARQLVWGW